MHTHARTDVGRQRDSNEDAVFTDYVADKWHIIAVADGMGGHHDGDIASQIVIDEIEPYLKGQVNADMTHAEVLRTLALHLNETLQAHADSGSSMGTTLVAGIATDRGVTLVNVGDSRAYHIYDDTIEQVTKDHSLVQELVESGTISEQEAEEHPQRNVITQSLGPSGDIDPDTYTIEVQGTLLLCSDGLTEEVADEEIHEIVTNSKSLRSATDELVTRANQNGGSDNVSVILATPSSTGT